MQAPSYLENDAAGLSTLAASMQSALAAYFGIDASQIVISAFTFVAVRASML